MVENGLLWRVCRQAAAIGFFPALSLFVNRRLRRSSLLGYRVKPRKVRHPLLVRPGTSDIHAFYQVFVQQEYALDCLIDGGVILDCGANVGYASIFFLSRLPSSRVVAVEPDKGNFDALQTNLGPYHDRAMCVRAGVWSRIGRLAESSVPFRDGLEWTRQFQYCGDGEVGYCEALDVPALMARAGAERVSILKMDIEGAEREVFREGCDAWVDRVDLMIIELHDDTLFGPASPVFMNVVRRHGFTVSRHGDLTVCVRER